MSVQRTDAATARPRWLNSENGTDASVLFSLSSGLQHSYTASKLIRTRVPAMSQFFSDSERILSSPHDIPVSAYLQRVARAIVPSFADFCFIFLVDGADVRCAGSAHRTREGARLLRGLNRVYKIRRTDPVSTVAHVLRTGRPMLRSDIKSEAAARFADHVFVLHRRLGARSALVAPIGAAPNVFGAISLSFAESGRRYTAQHFPRARRLAGLIAAYLSNRDEMMRAHPHLPTAPRRLIRLRVRA